MTIFVIKFSRSFSLYPVTPEIIPNRKTAVKNPPIIICMCFFNVSLAIATFEIYVPPPEKILYSSSFSLPPKCQHSNTDYCKQYSCHDAENRAAAHAFLFSSANSSAVIIPLNGCNRIYIFALYQGIAFCTPIIVYSSGSSGETIP